MRSVLRETLLNQVLSLRRVTHLQSAEPHRFVVAYFHWLEDIDKQIAGLREPMSAIFQAEKSKILAALEGVLPPGFPVSKNSRKAQRALAAQSLEAVTAEIYRKIEQIDSELEKPRENLSQSVAVIALKHPDLFDGLSINQAALSRIWETLGKHSETLTMYSYLKARLSTTDRHYLLTDILHNYISQATNSPLLQGAAETLPKTPQSTLSASPL